MPETTHIGSTAAARILGVTVASVCRWTQTGYLPAVRRVVGAGREGNIYDRATVEGLAARRDAAMRVLDWHTAAEATA